MSCIVIGTRTRVLLANHSIVALKVLGRLRKSNWLGFGPCLAIIYLVVRWSRVLISECLVSWILVEFDCMRPLHELNAIVTVSSWSWSWTEGIRHSLFVDPRCRYESSAPWCVFWLLHRHCFVVSRPQKCHTLPRLLRILEEREAHGVRSQSLTIVRSWSRCIVTVFTEMTPLIFICFAEQAWHCTISN